MKTEEKFEIGNGRIGESPLHLSGRDHVTGRSQFVDDIPKPRHLLQAKFLTSPVARGHITKLDYSKALEIPEELSPGTSGHSADAEGKLRTCGGRTEPNHFSPAPRGAP